MIVRDLDGDLLCITQSDHAHWAYQLLSVWPDLARHPRRSAILVATRQHDRGWQGIDSSPTVDGGGRPHDFLSLPASLREEVWRRGVRFDAGGQPLQPDPPAELDEAWSELLIAHHAWTIHRPERSKLGSTGQRSAELVPLVSALVAERRRLLEIVVDLGRSAGLEAPEQRIEVDLEDDYRWLRALDFLSLVACNGWTDPFDVTVGSPSGATMDVRFRDETLFLSPFPLRGSVSLPVRARTITNRRYGSSTELALELARATWRSRSLKVARG